MKTLFYSSMIAAVVVSGAGLYGMEKGNAQVGDVVEFPGSPSSSPSNSPQSTPVSSPRLTPSPSPRAGCLALDAEYLARLAQGAVAFQVQRKQQEEHKNGSL